jgi:hypothetical protein
MPGTRAQTRAPLAGVQDGAVEGPTVVLLHGGGLDDAGLSWTALTPRVAGHATVVTPSSVSYPPSEVRRASRLEQTSSSTNWCRSSPGSPPDGTSSPAPTGRDDYPVLVIRGVLLRAIPVIGQLAPDGVIDLVDLQLDTTWPEEDAGDDGAEG